MSEFLLLITGFFNTRMFNDISLIIFLLVSHLVVLFGVFGYNELIVIHVWELDFNTKQAIMDRATNPEVQLTISKIEKKGPLLNDC